MTDTFLFYHPDARHPHFITRNDSQLTLSPRPGADIPRGFGSGKINEGGLTRHPRTSGNAQTVG